ncbi:MAG: YlbF family regulator [Spirochaetota bacterium]
MSLHVNTVDAASKSPVMEASMAFSAAFMEAAPYKEYLSAAEAVENDQKAQKLLKQVEEAQAELQAKTSWGGITPEDLDQLNELEAEMKRYEPAARYIAAQEDVIAFTRAVNERVSSHLGADFASLAAPAHSCGCGAH